MIVPKQAIKIAAEKMTAYQSRLARKKRLGFRPPDQLNLYRAFVAVAAQVGPLTPRSLLLQTALDLPFEC